MKAILICLAFCLVLSLSGEIVAAARPILKRLPPP